MCLFSFVFLPDCFVSSSDSRRSGLLLLCEVALGESNELLKADYNASNLPPGKLSTKGVRFLGFAFVFIFVIFVFTKSDTRCIANNLSDFTSMHIHFNARICSEICFDIKHPFHILRWAEPSRIPAVLCSCPTACWYPVVKCAMYPWPARHCSTTNSSVRMHEANIQSCTCIDTKYSQRFFCAAARRYSVVLARCCCRV